MWLWQTAFSQDGRHTTFHSTILPHPCYSSIQRWSLSLPLNLGDLLDCLDQYSVEKGMLHDFWGMIIKLLSPSSNFVPWHAHSWNEHHALRELKLVCAESTGRAMGKRLAQLRFQPIAVSPPALGSFQKGLQKLGSREKLSLLSIRV